MKSIRDFDLPEQPKTKQANNKAPQIKIQLMYKPQLDILSFFDLQKGEIAVSHKQVKDALELYYKKHELVVKGNPRNITLDDRLKSKLEQESNSQMTREVVLDKFIKKMKLMHLKEFNSASSLK